MCGRLISRVGEFEPLPVRLAADAAPIKTFEMLPRVLLLQDGNFVFNGKSFLLYSFGSAGCNKKLTNIITNFDRSEKEEWQNRRVLLGRPGGHIHDILNNM